jgi:hypothetical protein
MLLPNGIHTSSLQSFNLFAIGCLQGPEDSDIAGLELVGGVRRHTAKDDTIFKTKLQDFEDLVCPEAIPDEYPWFHISSLFSLGIKHSIYIFKNEEALVCCKLSNGGNRKILFDQWSSDSGAY